MSYRGKSRRKPYFSSNLMARKNKDLFLKPGIKGFLCTCNGNEKQCIRESYNILNEYADTLYGEENRVTKLQPNEEGDNKHEEDDEIDAFQKEVAVLKLQNRQSDRRFLAVDAGVLNCVFIKTNLDDPIALSDFIVRDLAHKKVLKARFLTRMIPIEITCRAAMDEVIRAAGPLLDRHFKTDPVTFAVVIEKRCNKDLNRDALIEKLAGMVTERNIEHKVNLSDPVATIIVEVMKGMCGLAVIHNYYQFGKYNLRQICGLPLNDQEDGSNVESSKSNVNPGEDAVRNGECISNIDSMSKSNKDDVGIA